MSEDIQDPDLQSEDPGVSESPRLPISASRLPISASPRLPTPASPRLPISALLLFWCDDLTSHTQLESLSTDY
jgi:hypothetical protein